MGSKPRSPDYLIGQTFGQLTVLSLSVYGTASGKRRYLAECSCTCGNQKKILTASLRSGRTKTCGCGREQYKKLTGKNSAQFVGFEEISGTFWKHYTNKAKRRGLEVAITMEEAWKIYEAQGRRCALSGVEIGFAPANQNRLTTASMDRLDNDLGYTKDNVQWVHKWVNLMRNTLEVDQFLWWCHEIASNNPDNLGTPGHPSRMFNPRERTG